MTAQAVTDIVMERLIKAQVPRKERCHLKKLCDHGYNNWSETELNEDIRVNRETFELLLNKNQRFPKYRRAMPALYFKFYE